MRRTFLVGLLLMTPVAASAQETDTPRTPWGAPDLSGYWEYRSTTPLERPEALAGKAVLTPAEEAEYLTLRHAVIGRERDLQLNADWWQPGGLTEGRTSLIVDPPDGRLPERTPAGRERRAPSASRYVCDPRTAGRTANATSAASWDARSAPRRLTEPARADLPDAGHVAILHEQNSDLRIIPLDGRPPPTAPIRQWQAVPAPGGTATRSSSRPGASTGAWTIQGTGPNARYVERIRLAGPDTLHYEFTTHDPTRSPPPGP